MDKPTPKIALAMIIKPDDREAELLDRCLGGVDRERLPVELLRVPTGDTDGLAKHVDAIYLTITGENQKCLEIAQKYGAIVSHFQWNNSFSDARNFNFSQVPKEYDYIIWTDADDVWKSPELLKPLVTRMTEGAVDVVNLYYNYRYDTYGNLVTQHIKSRIIKNDNCLTWNGAELHEDFKPERRLFIDLNKEIQVIHLTHQDRLNSALERNTRISELSMAKHPEDPRSYWNLANCYFSGGRYANAIQLYLDFLGTSQSEEERATAWHWLAICYKELGHMERAVQCELEVFHLRPWLPDPFFGLGELYMTMGKYRWAREMFEMGFTKKLETIETKIAWNPREYDYKPRLQLAEVYVRMAKPREAIDQLKLALKVYPDDSAIKTKIKSLKKEVKKYDFANGIYRKAMKLKNKDSIQKLLDTVPSGLKYYPAIIALRNRHFIKEISSGKDVAIFCGHTEHEWNPKVFRTEGVGGSEEAIIQLVKRWAKDGWNVEVYANVGTREFKEDGVWWKPFMAWNYRDKQDVTVIWRHPKIVDYDINSDMILIDMHDVIHPGEFTPERLAKITKVMFKSKVHREYCSNIPDDKIVIVPHGLDIGKFAKQAAIVKRNPYKIINTSSPDRGLLTSMEIIERVYEALPDDLKPKLKFRWNYGFKIWDIMYSDDEKMLAWKQKAVDKMYELKKKGIMEDASGAMISQDEIVDQYLESGIMLYPSEFFEIGFISGCKAILAGAIPATTDVFAQGEFLKEGIICHSDADYTKLQVDIASGLDFGVATEEQKQFFVDNIVNYLKNPEQFEPMRERLTQYAKDTFDWNRTAKSWEEVFNGRK